MKKLLSLILAAVMLTAAIPAAAAFVFAEAAEAPETVEVGSADALKTVIAEINAGTKANNTNITLTNDIDLTGVEGWKPLKNYKGTFDGAGRTIKNLTHAVTFANNDNDKLDGGKNTGEYVMKSAPSGGDGFGETASVKSAWRCSSPKPKARPSKILRWKIAV